MPNTIVHSLNATIHSFRAIRPINICSFAPIRPINTVSEGILQGHYTDYYRLITNQTVPLRPAQGEKTLHLVCFNQTIEKTEYVELLRTRDKQPCRDCPNYLLGLMAQVSEDQMPEELRDKNIVAAEPGNPASAFVDKDGRLCYLFVSRFTGDKAKRELRFADKDGRLSDFWSFLAEDMPLTEKAP